VNLALAAYNANVLSVLEYSSEIWAGAAKSHLVRVESVQHTFLMWLAHNTDEGCPSLAYDRLLSFYGLQSLHARRVKCDVLFLYKVFRGYIASSHILQSFAIHVPPRTTRIASQTLFHVPFGRVACVSGGLFVRCPRSANDFIAKSRETDFFNERIGAIKKHITAYSASLRLVYCI